MELDEYAFRDCYPEKHVCVYIYTFLYNGAFQSLSCELVSGKTVSMNTGSPIVLVFFFFPVCEQRRVLERQQTINLFELFQYR